MFDEEHEDITNNATQIILTVLALTIVAVFVAFNLMK